MDFNSLIFPPSSRHARYHHKPAGIYNMFVPMQVGRPTNIFASASLISTGMPTSRSFVTQVYEPQEQKIESPHASTTTTTTESPNAGSFLFGMVSRIFNGIMKTVEEVVSPKKVVPDTKSKTDIFEKISLLLPKVPATMNTTTNNDCEFMNTEVLPMSTDPLLCDRQTSTTTTTATKRNVVSPPKSPSKHQKMYLNHKSTASPKKYSSLSSQHRRPRQTKNRGEKMRHEIFCDIQEAASDSDLDSDYAPKENCKLKIICETTDDDTDNDDNSIRRRSSFEFSPKDFPCLQPIKTRTPEAFVIFDTQIVKYTPSAGPPSQLKSLLSRLPCHRVRRRTMSEQSDDCVVFFDSDTPNNDLWGDTDDDDDEEEEEEISDDEEETEQEETDCDESDDEEIEITTSTKSNQVEPQFDSGFEEDGPKKQQKSGKKVGFILEPTVHVIRAWDYAYRAARKGEWEQIGRDRERFNNRIRRSEEYIGPVLASQHREKVFKSRFA